MDKPSELEWETPEIKDAMEGDVSGHSKIASVEVKKASEVYKEKARDPERAVVKVKAEDDAELTFSLPKGMEYTDGAWRVINKLQQARSLRNKLSKFGAFVRKYRKYPNIGVEIETDLDDEGFARIVVE